MESTPALKPDLERIDALAAHAVHHRSEEGAEALTIYDDICWRLALTPLPPELASQVARLEVTAADLLRRYVGHQLEPEAFWPAFRAMVGDLETLSDAALAHAAGEQEAIASLRALSRRVSEARLAPPLRAQVQVVLEHLAEALEAYHAGTLPGHEFRELFEEAERTIDWTLEVLAAAPPETPSARLQALMRRALASDPPAPLRQPISEAVAALDRSWKAAQSVHAEALEALEALLERAEAFEREHGEAERRYRHLAQASQRHGFPEAYHEEALDQLDAMASLLGALEAGELTPERFHVRFEVAAHRLEVLLAMSPELNDAVAALMNAVGQVRGAEIRRRRGA